MSGNKCTVLKPYHPNPENNFYPSVATAVYHHIGDDEPAGVVETLQRTVSDQKEVICKLIGLLSDLGVVTEDQIKDRILDRLYANSHEGKEQYPLANPKAGTLDELIELSEVLKSTDVLPEKIVIMSTPTSSTPSIFERAMDRQDEVGDFYGHTIDGDTLCNVPWDYEVIPQGEPLTYPLLLASQIRPLTSGKVTISNEYKYNNGHFPEEAKLTVCGDLHIRAFLRKIKEK